MDTTLRKYAIKQKDWHLIRDDDIFIVTRQRLERGVNEYPYLVFDKDEWVGSNSPTRCEFREGKYREIKIKIYEKSN